MKRLLTILFGAGYTRIDRKLQDAVQAHARLRSECYYNRSMAEFYEDRAAAIEPSQNWWGYADAMQKNLDFINDSLVIERRANGWLAKVRARTAQLTKLREQE